MLLVLPFLAVKKQGFAHIIVPTMILVVEMIILGNADDVENYQKSSNTFRDGSTGLTQPPLFHSDAYRKTFLLGISSHILPTLQDSDQKGSAGPPVLSDFLYSSLCWLRQLARRGNRVDSCSCHIQ